VRIGSATSPAALVIGVVSPSKHRTLGDPPRPALWRTLLRSPRSRTTILVRTAGDERALMPLIQATMREIDPSLAVVGLATLRDHVSVAYSAVRGAAIAMAGFGVLATLLAAAGIYGVIAYGVAQRRREIGIRMALGAGRGAVVRLSVTRILTLTLAGAAVGLAVVLLVPMGLDALLLGVSPRDPVTLGGAVLLFVLTAAIAAAAPARRAAGLEPMRVLRLD
jgi:ABC-type antimicrobial peptide transport system permease subunit